jgi:hypothetical protein
MTDEFKKIPAVSRFASVSMELKKHLARNGWETVSWTPGPSGLPQAARGAGAQAESRMTVATAATRAPDKADRPS